MSDAVSSAASDTVLETRALSREYRLGGETIRAVQSVSFAVTRGEYIAIVGPSGCGKSTLLNLLGAIDRPTSGAVLIGGRNIATLSDRDATNFRLRHIGFVFQRFYLMSTLSAVENVQLPMAEARVPRRSRIERSRALLAYVGLEKRISHRPAELSGGEQQRVAIARALANDPYLILADEPTGELDARTGAGMITLFEKLHADGKTILVVTHDEELAAAARRVIHMRDGTIVSDDVVSTSTPGSTS